MKSGRERPLLSEVEEAIWGLDLIWAVVEMHTSPEDDGGVLESQKQEASQGEYSR
jgi:hypothetical protein